MTAGWRECADPVELAAAVAAGVEVQVITPDEFKDALQRTRYRVPASWSYEPPAPVTGDDLRERIARAIWEDDERAKRDESDDWDAKLPTDHEVYLANADAVLAVLPAPPIDEGAGPSGPPWCLALDVWMELGGEPEDFDRWAHHEDERRGWGDAWAQICAAVGGSRMEGDTNPPPGTILDLPSYQWVRESPTPPPVPPWPDGVLRDAANRLRWIANSGYIEDPGIKRIIRSRADELDATLVTPWPGAVLSGLVDEDGVPTWLAQAGQVRGEQVRGKHVSEWYVQGDTGHWAQDAWVEVRAPRAAPEPETTRVPWWEAVEDDRDVTVAQGGPTFSAWLRLRDPEGGWWLVVNGCTDLATAYKQKIAPDGTVEVLRQDGDR